MSRQFPHIYPESGSVSPQLVLQQASVSGLAVPRVECELEHQFLDIRPPFPFFPREVVGILPRLHRFDVRLGEVPPFVFGVLPVVRDSDQPSLGVFPLVGHARDGVDYVDAAVPLLVAEPSGSSLDAGEDRPRCDVPVVLALVPSVGVDLLDLASGHAFGTVDGVLEETLVGAGRTLHGDARHQRRGAFLTEGLGGVDHEALHLLVTLLPVFGVRVVGVLDAVGGYLLPVLRCHLELADGVLLVEHPVQEAVLEMEAEDDLEDQGADLGEPLLDRGGVAGVDRLLGVLPDERLCLRPEGGVQPVHVSRDLLHERPVDYLVTGIPGDVAPNEGAVHPDHLPVNAELERLLAGRVLEALRHQVLAALGLVLAQPAAEQVVRVNRRAGVAEVHQTQGPPRHDVGVTLLDQGLVRQLEPLLYYAHRHEYPDGRVRGTHAVVAEQRGEYPLVDLAGDLVEEHVAPGLGVLVLLRSPRVDKIPWIVKQRIRGGIVRFSEHINQAC